MYRWTHQRRHALDMTSDRSAGEKADEDTSFVTGPHRRHRIRRSGHVGAKDVPQSDGRVARGGSEDLQIPSEESVRVAARRGTGGEDVREVPSDGIGARGSPDPPQSRRIEPESASGLKQETLGDRQFTPPCPLSTLIRLATAQACSSSHPNLQR